MIIEKIKSIVNKITLSHVMCIFIGALVPMFLDVFLLHEISSSTVSAFMDTIMAGAAIYAAFSVKDWLAPKINDKAFEEANLCITYLMDAQIKASEIFKNIQLMYNYLGTNDLTSNDKIYSEINQKNNELLTGYEVHMTNLNAKIFLMKVWGLEIQSDKKDEFNKFIANYIEFLEHSKKMLTILNDVNGMARKKNYDFHFISYNAHLAITQILPVMWFTSWKGLFQVSKTSTKDNG